MLNVNTEGYWRTVGRAAVTTTLSGAAGTLTALVSAFARHKAWDLLACCNGTLVGFVSITAGCHVLEPWAALLAGACSGARIARARAAARQPSSSLHSAASRLAFAAALTENLEPSSHL